MKPLTAKEAKTAKKLLLRCTEVLPEGFRVDLSERTEEWAKLSRALGSKRLCAFAAATLSEQYRKQFGEPFLFSAPCMTFELRYHLNAYLSVKGYRHVRHVTTLLFRPALIERKCRSIEIDTGDVYRLTQRIAFRYFSASAGNTAAPTATRTQSRAANALSAFRFTACAGDAAAPPEPLAGSRDL